MKLKGQAHHSDCAAVLCIGVCNTNCTACCPTHCSCQRAALQTRHVQRSIPWVSQVTAYCDGVTHTQSHRESVCCAGYARAGLCQCHHLGPGDCILHQLCSGPATGGLDPSGYSGAAGRLGVVWVCGHLPGSASPEAPAQDPGPQHHAPQEDEPAGAGETLLPYHLLPPGLHLEQQIKPWPFSPFASSERKAQTGKAYAADHDTRALPPTLGVAWASSDRSNEAPSFSNIGQSHQTQITDCTHDPEAHFKQWHGLCCCLLLAKPSSDLGSSSYTHLLLDHPSNCLAVSKGC